MQPKSFAQNCALEALEGRRLCYASIPTADVAIDTVQIRPASATYASGLTLDAGVTYFLRATGYTKNGKNLYAGDAAFEAASATTTTTTASSWGITTNVGTTTVAPTGWGAAQSDHIYGQYIKPTASGVLTFAFSNDGTDKTSNLAVTIYAPAPIIEAATIQSDDVARSVAVSSLGSRGILIPLNDADFDDNGVADDKQKGAVQGDKFLVPLTLPAIPGATATSHYLIDAPKGVRVWLNPDRTGSTVGLALRASKSRIVYVEGISEQPKGAAVNLQISVPVAGTSVTETVPVSVFALAGPTNAAAGTKQVFSSDSPSGNWLSAINGTLDKATISTVHHVAFANVVWNDNSTIGYADFQADADYLWGWPVEITV